MTKREWARMLKTARKDGESAGRVSGSWVVDGNTTEATAARILQAMRDGDPALDDMINVSVPNLSGEWAGDTTPTSLAEDVGLDMDAEDWAHDLLDELCWAWEDGASVGFYGEIESACEHVVGR